MSALGNNSFVAGYVSASTFYKTLRKSQPSGEILQNWYRRYASHQGGIPLLFMPMKVLLLILLVLHSSCAAVAHIPDQTRKDGTVVCDKDDSEAYLDAHAG